MPSNEEILKYVMNTPNNTNPAVLRDMLNNVVTQSGGSLVIHTTMEMVTPLAVDGEEGLKPYPRYTMDKTFAEIKTAFASMPCFVVIESRMQFVEQVNEDSCTVSIFGSNGSFDFYCEGDSDYPVLEPADDQGGVEITEPLNPPVGGDMS